METERQVLIDLMRLKSAISKNQKEFCIEFEQRYSMYLPRSCHFVQNYNPVTQRKDTLASILLPTDVPEELIPVKVTADGNCLYNSASVLVTGDQSLSNILRLLTAVELYLHSHFYAHHQR
jgi:hypothetical protein